MAEYSTFTMHAYAGVDDNGKQYTMTDRGAGVRTRCGDPKCAGTAAAIELGAHSDEGHRFQVVCGVCGHAYVLVLEAGAPGFGILE